MAEFKSGKTIKLAEYSVYAGLKGEPAFNWWVKHTLQQRDRLSGRLKGQRIPKGRMKFKVEIPGTVEEAVSLDDKNGNSLFQGEFQKEMNN